MNRFLNKYRTQEKCNLVSIEPPDKFWIPWPKFKKLIQLIEKNKRTRHLCFLNAPRDKFPLILDVDLKFKKNTKDSRIHEVHEILFKLIKDTYFPIDRNVFIEFTRKKKYRKF